MTNYRSGADFERRVKAALEADGYWVTRSAGSHSAVDLTALKRGEVVLVQVKRNGRISPAERVELRRLAACVGAVPIVAYKARVGLGYWVLTGDGPKDKVPWLADTVGAA